MIEIVNERSLEKSEVDRLPKNFRQIGEKNDYQRIYIEDYVYTYLKQTADEMKEEQRVLILYGKKEIIDYQSTWFVNGVLQTDTEPFFNSSLIDEHNWQKINVCAAKYFPGLSVLGWCVIGQEAYENYEREIELTWKEFFREDQKLFLYIEKNEHVEELYLFENGQPIKQNGFYIYYEKNDFMQNYMLKSQGIREDYVKEEVETETGNDQAARQFRSLLQEKKEEIHRRRTNSFLYGISSVLVMVILIIGITMLNNYEKMEKMENTLNTISNQVEDGFAKSEQVTDKSVKIKKEMVNFDESIDKMKGEKTTKEIGEKTISDIGNQNEFTDVVECNNGVSDNTLEQSSNQLQETDEKTLEQEENSENKSVDKPQEKQPMEYQIAKGDTLVKICVRFYGDETRLKEICELNHIEDKDKILYGQKILLP